MPELLDTALAVSHQQEAEGRYAEAAATMLAPLRADPAPPNHYRRALNLARRGGDRTLTAEFVALAMAQFPQEIWPIEARLRLLKDAGELADLVALALTLPAARRAAPPIAFMAYAAAYRIESPKAAELRADLFAALPDAANPPLWQARIARLEHDTDAALRLFATATANDPADHGALRDLVFTALTHGRVGAHAAAILRFEPAAAGDLARSIRTTREVFAVLGGSLEAAARGEAPFAAVTTPGAVFELACTAIPPVAAQPDRRGLTMVGAWPASGGAERVLAMLFAANTARLKYNPVQLCVVELEPGGGDPFFYLNEAGAKAEDVIIAVPREPAAEYVRWLPRQLARRTQALLELLVALRPAVVHATLDMGNLCAGLAAVLAGVPRVILHVHNMRPTELSLRDTYTPDFDRCYRALLQRPEVTLVGVSDAVVADYADWIGVPAAPNLVAIPNGFDFTPFDDAAAAAAFRAGLGVAPHERLIGTAFRFTELKRADWWIDMAIAVARSDPDTRFVLFGDGELKPKAEATVVAAGLSHRIHFPGRVAALPALIGALDLFVLTSRTEGLPNVLIEAQASGVPILTFDVGGASETLLDGVTGRLVREQSRAAMIAAVRAALADRQWLAAAGAAARGFVRDRFAIRRMVDAFDGLYALDETPAPAPPAIVWPACNPDDATVRFAILMQWGRVGSNLIVNVIAQSGIASLAYERFNTLTDRDAQLRWYAQHYQLGIAHPSHALIGTKENVLALADPTTLAERFRADGIRVIRMRRDNLVKAAVSQIRAEAYAALSRDRTGRAQWGVKAGDTPLGPTAIDPGILLERVAIMADARDRLMALFTADEVLDIEYEAIRTALPATVAAVRIHLDLPDTAPFRTPYVKATPDDLRRIITNYDAVAQAVTRAGYGGMLAQ